MLEGKYISFRLGKEEFGMPILNVQEIIRPVSTTRLPEMPDYTLGILNMRGKVIPIIDLKKRMTIHTDNGNSQKEERIIIVTMGRISFGGLVDRIVGVVDVGEEDIDDAPCNFLDSKEEGATRYLKAVAKINGDRLLQLLDPSKIIPINDKRLLEDLVVKEETSEDGKVILTKKVSGMGGDYIIKEVCDRIVEKTEREGGDTEAVKEIVDAIQVFMTSLSSGEIDKAEQVLENIPIHGEKELFKEVGKITRNLYSSLVDFKTLIDPKLKNMAMEDMPEVNDQLKWVISRTEEATEKTLGLMEKNISRQSDVIKRLDLFDKFFEGKKVNDDVKEALQFLRGALEDMNSDFMEVIVAQEFQDLTGQIIKKVIDIISELEKQLVNLVKVFGVKIEPEKKKKYLKLGTSKKTTGDVASQEDVDELLKEFGF